MQSGVQNGIVSVEGTVSGVFDSLGNFFPLGSASTTYGYVAGVLTTETAVVNGATWVKTYTYGTDGSLANESFWVKQ